VSFAVATAISIRRWYNVHQEIQPLERARIDQERELMALRIERLPTCVWVRDFLKTKVTSARSTHDDGIYESWLAYSCEVREGHDQDWMPLGTVGEASRELAERVDASISELTDEVSRSVP
jgi:hypothetical protein